MKSAVTEHELEALVALPQTAVGAALVELLKREKQAELDFALVCVRSGKTDLVGTSLQRAAVLDEICSFLERDAQATLDRTAK